MVLGETGTVPVLQMVDNGLGMNHEEIVKMLSFGHKRPGESDAEQIGHFGVGFKVLSRGEVHSSFRLFTLFSGAIEQNNSQSFLLCCGVICWD